MSGGVDSSVAAALLAEQGHDVIGVSMQLYDQTDGQTSFGSCCSIDDLHDARRVAAAHRHPALHSQFRASVRRAGRDEFRAGVCVRTDAAPLRALQQRFEVRDARGASRRIRRRCGRHRSLRARRARRGNGALSPPARCRSIEGSGVLPVFAHAVAARPRDVSRRRSSERGCARIRAPAPIAGRRKAR